MPRYPKQDFQQNISFKCTMEFRFALKLAMEKTSSRDLSTFIRDHLAPAINKHLSEDELRGLGELNSPVRLKEALRAYFRYNASRITEAISQMLNDNIPTTERRAVELLKHLHAYEDQCTKVAEDPKSPVLLRAGITSVAADLTKLIKLLNKPWEQSTYMGALRIAAELPESLSLDVGNGLDFLNDEAPSRDKPYTKNRGFKDAWKRVAKAVAEERKTEAVLIHSLDYGFCDDDTFFVGVPEGHESKIGWLSSPRNTNLFLSKLELEIGRPAQIRFQPSNQLY